jgi:protein-S-isoprenylcysteine O-methyltransferase Ste14
LARSIDVRSYETDAATPAQAGSNVGFLDALKPIIGFLDEFKRTKTYDLVAALPLIAWYLFALYIQLPRIAHQLSALTYDTLDAGHLAGIASNLATQMFFIALVTMMVLRRPPRGKSSGFYPRFAAVAGTFLSLTIVVLPARDLSVALHVVSTVIIVGGVGFALYSVLALGRSLSMMPEARRLVTEGPYNVIRHPVYLGEAIALAGVTIQYLSPWALGLLALQCIFQLERMKNEERVLSSTFPAYRDYAARTARLVPGVY